MSIHPFFLALLSMNARYMGVGTVCMITYEELLPFDK
jgi:hypothetical protein